MGEFAFHRTIYFFAVSIFWFPWQRYICPVSLSINVGPSKFQRETALTGKLSLNIDRETVFLVSYVIDGETYLFCNYCYENTMLHQKKDKFWMLTYIAIHCTGRG